MANKTLFQTVAGAILPKADARNEVRNPRARLVCLDIQPNGTTQAAERGDILNVGGFSDAVFEIVSAFAQGNLRPGHWVEQIDQIEL